MENILTAAIAAQLRETAGTLRAMSEDAALHAAMAAAASACIAALRNGNKILFAGNGGSAADAQHLAGELVSRFNYDRPGLPAFSLSTDTSVLTAIGNDYGYERLFARQIEAVGSAGDVFIGISTSGRSPNILNALRTARDKGRHRRPDRQARRRHAVPVRPLPADAVGSDPSHPGRAHQHRPYDLLPDRAAAVP
jgi:D-sedoheptulose 7-phosphate isomerase